jgi:hypothetical protein
MIWLALLLIAPLAWVAYRPCKGCASGRRWCLVACDEVGRGMDEH